MARLTLVAALSAAVGAFAAWAPPALADEAQVARGRYLGGSDVGFAIPGAGIFVGQNLTPDKETGIGSWSSDQIVAAIRTGKTPDGKDLSPVMPWPALSHLTDEDAQAIAAFLKSIPPVDHKNAGPIGPNEKATVFVSVTLPADAYNAMQAKK